MIPPKKSPTISTFVFFFLLPEDSGLPSKPLVPKRQNLELNRGNHYMWQPIFFLLVSALQLARQLVVRDNPVSELALLVLKPVWRRQIVGPPRNFQCSTLFNMT